MCAASSNQDLIEFLCPNGHRIHCRAAQAGRAAKCPSCGVRFRIPDLADTTPADAGVHDSDVAELHFSDSGIGAPAEVPADDPAGAEEEIEFLCPNGHRLHGPASLQGHPGECPECGAKFRIPTYDDVPDEEPDAEQEISVGRSAASEASPSGKRTPGSSAAGSATGQRRIPADGPHPMATLFSRLWAQRSAGAKVELHFSDGQTLVPDRFAERLSQRKVGVFATKEPDGKHTVVVIAWDAVVRVMVRGMQQLPKEMGE